jgi:hypothetical protein
VISDDELERMWNEAVSNEKVISDDELERMWNEAVEA